MKFSRMTALLTVLSVLSPYPGYAATPAKPAALGAKPMATSMAKHPNGQIGSVGGLQQKPSGVSGSSIKVKH